MSFGKFFKHYRIKKCGKGSFRTFCRTYQFEPATISRLERELKQPPSKLHILKSYADALDVPEGKETEEFIIMGIIYAGRIPEEIMKDPEKIHKTYLKILEVVNEW
jgi:hypothetical protein